MRRALIAAVVAGWLMPAQGWPQVSSLRAAQVSVADRTKASQAAPALMQDQALRLSQGSIGQVVGDYTLQDSEGRPVRLSSLRGKPLLISFIYTGCFSVCPTTTRTLKRAVESAMRALGPDSFNVASIGFNVPFDTPAALRTFAGQHGVYFPNWLFLSPDAQTLEGLARDLGFSYARSAGGFDHITQVTILDQQGRVYRQVYGDSFPLPQLVVPLRELLTGTPPADESLAGFIERVRLLCTVYDPTTGRYRYKYSILFEIFGGLMGLSAMLIFLLVELRKTRRLQRAR
jgi:protein SCO1/2